MLANATSTQIVPSSSDSFLDDVPSKASPLSIPDRSAKQYTGWVAKILFYNQATDFAIIRFRDGVVAKGEWDNVDSINDGEQYRLYGEWREDERRGDYFAFSHAEPIGSAKLPQTIRKFLASQGGVSSTVATALNHAFGPDTLDVCRESPHEIVARGILTEAAAKELQRKLLKSHQFQELRIQLIEMFAGRGFSKNAVKACINKWGRRAKEIITRDPFKLLVHRIPGCGFKRCDQLYLDLGRPPQALRRQFFAAWHEIDSLDGDTWVLQGVISMALKKQFGKAAQVDKVIRLGVRAGWFAARPSNRPGIQLLAEARKAEAERRIVTQLLWLLDEQCTSPILWPGANTLVSTSLTDHQAAQLAPCLSSRVCLLAGTPGTGKTYVAAALIREVLARGAVTPDDIKVCAPTGRAAVRIGEYLQKNQVPVKTMTIHRLLEWRGDRFECDRDHPLAAKIVVVDETSMVDATLMANLLDAIPMGCHILFIGDPYQLPPVGHGAPLRDLLRCDALPKAALTEIKRNDGAIVRACAAIKDGKRFKYAEKFDLAIGDNLRFLVTESAGESRDGLQTVIESVSRSRRYDPVWETQVLCPLNARSEIACESLNTLLQNILNPLLEGEVAARNGFRLRDKIICRKNGFYKMTSVGFGHEGLQPTDAEHYEDIPDPASDSNEAAKVFVANGDQGQVLAISDKHIVMKFLWPDRMVRVPLGRKAKPEDEEETADRAENRQDDMNGSKSVSVDNFRLAYAITGHKAQGSSWPFVILMADEAGGMVASREWWYTSIARGEKMTMIIGNPEVVFRQCTRTALNSRRTFLKETIEWEFMCKRLPEGF